MCKNVTFRLDTPPRAAIIVLIRTLHEQHRTLQNVCSLSLSLSLRLSLAVQPALRFADTESLKRLEKCVIQIAIQIAHITREAQAAVHRGPHGQHRAPRCSVRRNSWDSMRLNVIEYCSGYCSKTLFEALFGPCWRPSAGHMRTNRSDCSGRQALRFVIMIIASFNFCLSTWRCLPSGNPQHTQSVRSARLESTLYAQRSSTKHTERLE